MKEELENLKLQAIVYYGYKAMPLDYRFLSSYSLLNIYYAIVDAKTSGLNSDSLEIAVKAQAKQLLNEGCDYSTLYAYQELHGPKFIKDLLESKYYWKAWLRNARKKLTK